MSPLAELFEAGQRASPLPPHYWFTVRAERFGASQLEVRDPVGAIVAAFNLRSRPSPASTAVAAWALAVGAWHHARELAR